MRARVRRTASYTHARRLTWRGVRLPVLAVQVLSEYLAAKAVAAGDKAGAAASVSAAKQAPAAAPHSSAPASPPRREAAPAAGPAPVSRATTAPSLAQDVKGLWNLDLERPAAPKPAVRAAPAGGSEDLLVADVEELDIDDELGQVRSTASRSRGGVQEAASRPISMAEAGALKKLVFGNGKLTFNSAWTQGVFPSSTEGLSYGIVQREGGPCGVLATVQAFLLRHLLFMDDSLASSRPPALCSRKVPCDPVWRSEECVPYVCLHASV